MKNFLKRIVAKKLKERRESNSSLRKSNYQSDADDEMIENPYAPSDNNLRSSRPNLFGTNLSKISKIESNNFQMTDRDNFNIPSPRGDTRD
jgi:hypothetical protein